MDEAGFDRLSSGAEPSAWTRCMRSRMIIAVMMMVDDAGSAHDPAREDEPHQQGPH